MYTIVEDPPKNVAAIRANPIEVHHGSTSGFSTSNFLVGVVFLGGTCSFRQTPCLPLCTFRFPTGRKHRVLKCESTTAGAICFRCANRSFNELVVNSPFKRGLKPQ